MTYSDIPRLLTMTIFWQLLLVWYLLADRINCGVALALLALLTMALFISGAEMKLTRRRIFLDECLEPRTFLFRVFQRRYVLLVFEFLKAAVLALFLMVSVLDFVPRHWSLMFAVVLLLGLLLPRFHGALAGQLREEYRYVTARRWAMWVSTIFLWLESLIVFLFADERNFSGLRWQEVISYGASEPDLACTPLASMASILSAVDALGQWAIQNFARSFMDLPQGLIASIGILVAVGLSFLQAYAYSRVLIGVVGRPWTMWRVDSPGPT
ncbi:MAG TPA: hypothetical protein VES73_01545 [Lamprocystis sp. (in: g-proteobacteria)]|nr:hypothetical protein [Lamprocystis sp. (in: g-proteobacteria)]